MCKIRKMREMQFWLKIAIGGLDVAGRWLDYRPAYLSDGIGAKNNKRPFRSIKAVLVYQRWRFILRRDWPRAATASGAQSIGGNWANDTVQSWLRRLDRRFKNWHQRRQGLVSSGWSGGIWHGREFACLPWADNYSAYRSNRDIELSSQHTIGHFRIRAAHRANCLALFAGYAHR
jgi:hypothetical protein